MRNRDIIDIGGSSGATAPIKTILAAPPPDLPAAVFIVLHIPARSIGILSTVASAAGLLPVHQATEAADANRTVQVDSLIVGSNGSRRAVDLVVEPLKDLCIALESCGAEIVGPAPLERALPLAASENLACAILDINLRGESGLVIAETLRQRGVPFIY